MRNLMRIIWFIFVPNKNQTISLFTGYLVAIFILGKVVFEKNYLILRWPLVMTGNDLVMNWNWAYVGLYLSIQVCSQIERRNGRVLGKGNLNGHFQHRQSLWHCLGPNHDRVLIVGHNTELIGSMNKKKRNETKSGNRLYWARQKSLVRYWLNSKQSFPTRRDARRELLCILSKIFKGPFQVKKNQNHLRTIRTLIIHQNFILKMSFQDLE